MRGCAVSQFLPHLKSQILISQRHFQYPRPTSAHGEAHLQVRSSEGSCGLELCFRDATRVRSFASWERPLKFAGCLHKPRRGGVALFNFTNFGSDRLV